MKIEWKYVGEYGRVEDWTKVPIIKGGIFSWKEEKCRLMVHIRAALLIPSQIIISPMFFLSCSSIFFIKRLISRK